VSAEHCPEVHPSGAVCVMPPGQHAWHTGTVPHSMPPRGADWPNEGYVAPLKTMTKGQRELHKASLRERVRAVQGPNNLVQNSGAAVDDMTASWAANKADWLASAARTLHGYCQGHAGPFTTPEDIWPLLDNPGEMRAFSVTVQRALKRRWMTEVGAVRLPGTYSTRDGVTFKQNKFCPIYQSLIALDQGA